jgi:hypothetical protein
MHQNLLNYFLHQHAASTYFSFPGDEGCTIIHNKWQPWLHTLHSLRVETKGWTDSDTWYPIFITYGGTILDYNEKC